MRSRKQRRERQQVAWAIAQGAAMAVFSIGVVLVGVQWAVG